MATTTRPAASGEVIERTAPTIPPLRNGDRLSRVEFERRYDAMPHLKKAELIEGVVYIPSPDFYLPGGSDPLMSSPVSFRRHANPHYKIINWLGHYSAATPGLEGGDNGSLRLDLDNMPQPDAFLIILSSHGGQARISDDDYVEGAPELVVEVAYSSVSYDLHAKLHVFRRNGVREYVVWRVEDWVIDWYILREGRFEPASPTPEGHYRSEVFPGLRLDPAALVRGDLSAVFEVVQRGLATPEHADFVARLRQAAAPHGTERDAGP
jgi:Uma2 family endonuclease